MRGREGRRADGDRSDSLPEGDRRDREGEAVTAHPEGSPRGGMQGDGEGHYGHRHGGRSPLEGNGGYPACFAGPPRLTGAVGHRRCIKARLRRLRRRPG